jgi:hypothetical protein
MTTPWLPLTTPQLERSIIDAARHHLGVCEDPQGSNRGPEIDAWNLAAGVPLASFWCASFVAAMYRACGAETPSKGRDASCDEWMAMGKRLGSWRAAPSLGAAVLYGVPGDAKHIGIVVRLTPLVLSVEGNTTVEGSKIERNGTAVALKIVDKTDPVLGYVVPMFASSGARSA